MWGFVEFVLFPQALRGCSQTMAFAAQALFLRALLHPWMLKLNSASLPLAGLARKSRAQHSSLLLASAAARPAAVTSALAGEQAAAPSLDRASLLHVGWKTPKDFPGSRQEQSTTFLIVL